MTKNPTLDLNGFVQGDHSAQNIIHKGFWLALWFGWESLGISGKTFSHHRDICKSLGIRFKAQKVNTSGPLLVIWFNRTAFWGGVFHATRMPQFLMYCATSVPILGQ